MNKIVMEDGWNKTIRQMQILDEIDVIKQTQIKPLKDEFNSLQRSVRELVGERNQEMIDFSEEA